MKAVVRKEALELAVSFGPILVAVCLVWLGVIRFEEVLLPPNEAPMASVLFTAAGAGLLTALVQFEGERIRGTWGYLIHRGAGIDGCFRTKAWTGIAASMLLGFVPALVFAIVHATILGEARVVQWARVVEYAGIATTGAAAYAIAVIAICLRRGLFSEILLAISGIAAWLAISVKGMFVVALVLEVSGNHPGIVAGFAAVQVGAAAGFLRLARRVFAAWRDRDLPLAASHHTILLGLAVVLWIPIPLVILGTFQWKMISSFIGRAPFVLRDRSNGELMMVAPIGDDKSFARLEDGRLVSDERLRGYHRWAPDDEREVVYEPRAVSLDRPANSSMLPRVTSVGDWSWGSPSVSDSGGGFDTSMGIMGVRIWVDRDAGVLRHFALRHPGVLYGGTSKLDAAHLPPELPFERVVEKPSASRRFSRSTSILDPVIRRPVDHDDSEAMYVARNARTSEGSKCVADPEDRTLWSLDPLDFSSPLRKIELPDGDRFVDVGMMRFYDRRWLRVGQYWPRYEVCVRGEKSAYEWNGSGFVPVDVTSPESLLVPDDRADALVELRTVHIDPDPLAPAIEVRDARTGAVLLSHRYSLTENDRGTQAGVLYFVTLLRPAALNAIAYFHDTGGRVPPRGDIELFIETLLMNRSRTGLFLVSILFSIGLAALAARRAKERGAGHTVVRLSAILVAALGFPAFLVVELLAARKPRRRSVPVDARPEPAVLIQTVRAT